MVGFVLKNTLSDNGGVTRGICKVDSNRILTDITETHNIIKIAGGAGVETVEGVRTIDINSEVSMNMWGLTPDIFPILDKGFRQFLEETPKDNLKAEYLLPTIIGGLLKQNKIEVKVLQSNDKWFGVTYKEDKKEVMEAVKELIRSGSYSTKLG